MKTYRGFFFLFLAGMAFLSLVNIATVVTQYAEVTPQQQWLLGFFFLIAAGMNSGKRKGFVASGAILHIMITSFPGSEILSPQSQGIMLIVYMVLIVLIRGWRFTGW